ncbi:MAG: hypothetical protein P8Z49_03530 [Acidobacteriota bacterium]
MAGNEKGRRPYMSLKAMVKGYGKKGLILAAAAAVFMTAGTALFAQSSPELDPLLKILVQNGVITQAQAEKVQEQYNAKKAEKKQQDQEQIQSTVKQEVQKTSPVPGWVSRLHIGSTMYLSYQNGQKYAGVPGQTESYSQMALKRGYFDVKYDVNDWFQARFTTDITRVGDGSVNTRIKYLYGKFHWAGNDFFTKPYMEFGQVHVPYHDFWEAINGYRMQGTMFLERNGIFNSADDGVVFGSDFGGEMPASYKKNVDPHYAGRYGSWQLGVYDGGGYHAGEKNQNKVVEARFTLRPLPDVIPGLQIGVLGISGKGNVAPSATGYLPDWTAVDGMVSYESARFTATGEYYTGKGNQSGTAVNPDGTARKQDGYSFFAAAKVSPDKKFRVIGRYDRFNTSTEAAYSALQDIQKRYIFGVAYDMFKGNMWLLDYEQLEHSLTGIPNEKQLQLTLQVKF